MRRSHSSKATSPLQLTDLDLQRFAGGSNLTCRTCSYFRSGQCDLHHKQLDAKSEACSHYQGKKQI